MHLVGSVMGDLVEKVAVWDGLVWVSSAFESYAVIWKWKIKGFQTRLTVMSRLCMRSCLNVEFGGAKRPLAGL